MKKFSKILILLALSFIVGSQTLAATNCSWTEPITERTQTYSNDTLTVINSKVCPTGTEICSSVCSGTRPSDFLCCGKIVATPPAAKPRFIIPDYIFQVKIPGMSEKLSTVECTDKCAIPWISEYFFGVYNYLLGIAAVLAVVILMAAGLLWIVSGGDATRVGKAKTMIAGSITGLLLLVSISLLLSYINPDLVKMGSVKVDFIKKIVLGDNEVVSTSETPYSAECEASRKGDFTACQAAAKTNIKPANMVTVEGKDVNTTLAESYKKAMSCVAGKNNGKTLFQINEGWRSPAKQIEYYNTYLTEGKPRASKPCCSNHGSGKALDINRVDGTSMSWAFNVSSGLTACMNENALYAKLSDEPWHWSLTGK